MSYSQGWNAEIKKKLHAGIIVSEWFRIHEDDKSYFLETTNRRMGEERKLVSREISREAAYIWAYFHLNGNAACIAEMAGVFSELLDESMPPQKRIEQIVFEEMPLAAKELGLDYLYSFETSFSIDDRKSGIWIGNIYLRVDNIDHPRYNAREVGCIKLDAVNKEVIYGAVKKELDFQEFNIFTYLLVNHHRTTDIRELRHVFCMEEWKLQSFIGSIRNKLYPIFDSNVFMNSEKSNDNSYKINPKILWI